MSTQKQPAKSHKPKESDSVKESVTDIIDQLQDIDPSRLSFSPFLDLDTQISLAPISDSPESSVEELHSLPDENIGPVTEQSIPNVNTYQHKTMPQDVPSKHKSPLGAESLNMTNVKLKGNHTLPCVEGKKKKMATKPLIVTTETSFSTDTKVVSSEPSVDKARISPPQTSVTKGSGEKLETLEQTDKLPRQASEDQPLLGQSPDSETIDLIPNDSEPGEVLESCPKEGNADVNERKKSCCCYCQCCTRAHLKAILSIFFALILTPWILYGLYLFVPFEPPLCPDLTSRITFTLRCNVIAIIPILLGVLMGSLSRLCSPTIGPLDSNVRAVLIHQRYIGNSIEQFTIYCLNMLVMTTYLRQDQLKIIPILAGLFAVARLLYWVAAGLSSAYRGFGFGLTFFPTLAMVAYNLYCMYELGLDHHFGPLENKTTQSPGSSRSWWNLGG
uniref:Transmembrane protein 79 n=1 Tax=Callorhinchus milii TaxID=7868 RepID=A0A4W3GU03_CALMI|eukprot:gi/632961712/ref/XP_007896913.1/ PREDICTED: transmembrane protein 79 [Callorhinchus milii]